MKEGSSKVIGVGGLNCACCAVGGKRYAKRKNNQILRRKTKASMRRADLSD